MSSKVIVTSSNAPAAIGPYSQAVKANGMVYVSGCIGMDPSTKALVEGLPAQIHQLFANMKSILEASGSDLTQVVKCTVLLRDMAQFAEFNPIYAQYFPENHPARTTFAVAGLPLNALIEIDCIAISNA